MDAYKKQADMTAFTKWGIEHPWHVTKGMKVPADCGCKDCTEGYND